MSGVYESAVYKILINDFFYSWGFYYFHSTVIYDSTIYIQLLQSLQINPWSHDDFCFIFPVQSFEILFFILLKFPSKYSSISANTFQMTAISDCFIEWECCLFWWRLAVMWCLIYWKSFEENKFIVLYCSSFIKGHINVPIIYSIIFW